MTRNSLFPDAAARQIILENLDENLVVEAAAGTGKTTSLVGRIMNLFRAGRVTAASRIAAVTFTVKAAAELRERLEAELEKSLDRNPARAKNLLPECHIGTIHSFCARLLRERPVEAGVPPDFREIEPQEDMFYRKRAWDEFSRRLTGGAYPDLRHLYRAFEIFGLDLDTPGQVFFRFAEFPDIDDWPGRDSGGGTGGIAGIGGIDVGAFVRGLEEFTAHLDSLEPRLSDAECGNDEIIPILQKLVRRRRRQAPADIDIEAAFRLCRELKPKPKQVQKQWKDGLGLDKESAAEEKNIYARFYEDAVLPFRNQCLAVVYASSLAAFEHAKDIYDRLRRGDGVLNFQDLLMRAAAVLRDFPEVRRDLAGRYARLLVDEAQDTDPIQAEIMFLLTADDPRERDWRRCRPRPGSLFIVGDPKQSIYRFRRADITTYQEVKHRIARTGGRQIGLVTNFRSQPVILDWVNRTLFQDGASTGDSTGSSGESPGRPSEQSAPSPQSASSPQAIARSGRFGAEDSPYSPAYAPLKPGLSGAGADEGRRGVFSGVFSLETLSVNKKEGVDETAILRDEARRIALFIRHAVDAGLLLPGKNGPRPAQPDDFLIVTYQKSKASRYAESLRSLGIECLVSTGGALADSPALTLLMRYLDALLNPDDGIRLLAVLRGRLYGMADTELYRWKKAGGAFSFLAPAPPRSSGASELSGLSGLSELSGSPSPPSVADALAAMREHCRLFAKEEPVAALTRIVADLGLWEYAGLGDHPSESIGVLATALDLLAASRSELPTLGLLRDRLEWLIGNYDRDPLPARGSAGRAVRIMNLHKTKGLEAPVVFLASTRTVRSRDAVFAVRRDAEGSRGALAMYGGEHGNLLLARPAEWDELAADEELFLAAEKTRLNYVAATRAGAALVISVHRTASGWKSAFLPESTPPDAIPEKLPEPEPSECSGFSGASESSGTSGTSEPEAVAVPPLSARGGSFSFAFDEDSSDFSHVLAPSYSTERAKREDNGEGIGFEGNVSGAAGSDDPEWAADAGEILHRLIDLGANLKPRTAPKAKASKASLEKILIEMAEDLLREFDRPRAAAAELAGFVLSLRRSELWRRVEASTTVRRETPFTVRLDTPAGPVLRRGVIDLAFREGEEKGEEKGKGKNAGWVIVDYKSDHMAEGMNPQAAAQKHTPQLAAYAEAWGKITGEPVRETGIYFLRNGVYVRVSGA